MMMKKDPRGEYYGKALTWWIVGIMVAVFGLTILYGFVVGPEAFTGGAFNQ